ncbi:MAG: hypothetical protein JXB38_04970 [Anaerolineales bacterium]|nr:hypothetical protein [Anaerolineales bacterium]
MHKKSLFMALAALGLATLACSVTIDLPEDAIEVGDLVTDELDTPYPDSADTTELTINFGAGELAINPGAEGLLGGTATYNVPEFAPIIEVNDNEVELNQGDLQYEFTGIPNWDDVENEWNLELGTEPMELQIRAGAYDGELELGGLALEELKIFSGAASVKINFSEANLTEMKVFDFETGASDVEMTGLGNANFSRMDFDGGLGNYELDFSGDLQQDADVKISAGASSFTITIPEGVPATLTLNGALTNVDTSGDWAGSGTSYQHPGEGNELIIEIDLGVGNLELRTK